MSLKKVVGLLAGFALAVGLIGAGVGAVFTDSVTAKENINVGTFQCKIVAATPSAASLSADGKSLTYTAPTIMSSAAGSAPFSFTVQNTGTIADVLTVSTTPVSAPWSVINAPFAPAPLAAGATHVYNTGVSWTALDNSNLGQSGSVTWTVTCGENIPAVVFDNTPSALPVHGYALSFNGERTAEYGSQVGFAGSARKLQTATVDMVSYPCQNGNYNDATCVTTPGATYNVPITLNVFNVGSSNAVGALIGSVTQTFAIPYRPSADATCSDTNKFQGAPGDCYTALDAPITFDLSSLSNVPDGVIFGIAFATSDTGGAAGPWDSLNVMMANGAPTVGTTPIANTYRNATQSSFYADGGATGTFRLDTTVESEGTTSQIAIKVVATN